MASNNDFQSKKEIKFELYYSPGETPEDLIKESLNLLTKLHEAKGIDFEVVDSLDEAARENLKEEIRTAAERGKFKVVSGGGAALALSGTKKLNLINSPILVIRRKGRVFQAFPRGIQGIKGSKITATDFLRRSLISKNPLVESLLDISFTEKDLRNLVISCSSLIEEGLTFLDVEVKIGSAIIDLVLIDSQDNHLLLEFKLNANDKTIGQVTRYNLESYSQKMGIATNKIRRGIVTLKITGQIVEACKSNNIELYQIDLISRGYKSIGENQNK